ncbi:MAG TPA: hypothetical protein VLA66_14210, partial [Thermoanaerobaculia bacterium]|nr:hypothetical protein [Thermoanaerobaculia bacterium]
MQKTFRRLATPWLATIALLLTAGSALAFVVPEPSPLADKEIRPAGLDVEPALRRIAELDGAAAADLASAVARLGVRRDHAMLDARGGRWATLLLAQPLIPGTGVGNELTWDELGFVAAPGDAEIRQAAWGALARFVAEHRAELRLDPSELVPNVGVADGGAIVQIHAARQVNGVPVRGAGVTATVNHGNLILLGTERWGDVRVSTVPKLDELDAMNLLESYVAPLAPSGYVEKPHLELLPLGVDAAADAGYTHRLVWIVRPELP